MAKRLRVAQFRAQRPESCASPVATMCSMWWRRARSKYRCRDRRSHRDGARPPAQSTAGSGRRTCGRGESSRAWASRSGRATSRPRPSRKALARRPLRGCTLRAGGSRGEHPQTKRRHRARTHLGFDFAQNAAETTESPFGEEALATALLVLAHEPAGIVAFRGDPPSPWPCRRDAGAYRPPFSPSLWSVLRLCRHRHQADDVQHRPSLPTRKSAEIRDQRAFRFVPDIRGFARQFRNRTSEGPPGTVAQLTGRGAAILSVTSGSAIGRSDRALQAQACWMEGAGLRHVPIPPRSCPPPPSAHRPVLREPALLSPIPGLLAERFFGLAHPPSYRDRQSFAGRQSTPVIGTDPCGSVPIPVGRARDLTE